MTELNIRTVRLLELDDGECLAQATGQRAERFPTIGDAVDHYRAEDVRHGVPGTTTIFAPWEEAG